MTKEQLIGRKVACLKERIHPIVNSDYSGTSGLRPAEYHIWKITYSAVEEVTDPVKEKIIYHIP